MSFRTAPLSVPSDRDKETLFTAAIRDEILGIDDWAVHTVVAREGERLIGWLLAEVDDEIGCLNGVVP